MPHTSDVANVLTIVLAANVEGRAGTENHILFALSFFIFCVGFCLREENSSLTGFLAFCSHISAAGLTNRKFQSGKQAKKLAEKMSIQREFQRQQQQLQEQQARSEGPLAPGSSASGSVGRGDKSGGNSNVGEAGTTVELLQEYRERRGVSLMDQHLAKKAKIAPTELGNGERKAFDRERDLLSHGRMDSQKVASLVKGAKELDDRFDKAAVQKSFL
jgi:hypothetical protein